MASMCFPISDISKAYFKLNFRNFSASATLLTLQTVQIYNKEDLDGVRRVGDATLRSQLKKPEIKERQLRRKKYGF
jgi:hypothetical protein